MSPDNKLVNIDRSVASSGSGAREEEEHRMMASTTVFVLEPGVTALGNGTRNGGYDDAVK